MDRLGSGSQPKQQNPDSKNKAQIITMLEQQIMEKIRAQIKDAEQELEKQYKDKQDSQKDDEITTKIKAQITQWATGNTFKQISDKISQSQKFTPQEKTLYTKPFVQLQTLFGSLNQDKGKIRIKLNAFYESLVKTTAQYVVGINTQIDQLNQAGFCGKGEKLKAYQNEFRKWEVLIPNWTSITQLESNASDVQIIKPKINYDEIRSKLVKDLNNYFPETNGVQIIEKEKIVEKFVDRIVEKPVIQYVDKIVEKVVEKKVEVPQVKVEVKEVFRDVPQQDRIREAHEMLYGINRPQNIVEALNIYYEEAEVNHNVSAYNTIAQIFSEGKFFPQDLNKAYTYWEKSAASQDSEGLYRIGRLLLDKKIDGVQLSNGRLGSRDQEIDEAVIYLQQAVEMGHLDALVDLGEIFEYGIPSEDTPKQILIEIQLEQAEFYYLQGKKVRYPRALNHLGKFYLAHPEYKENVAGNNARKALKYFEMARDLGYAKAWFHLAQCYEQGLGIPIDLEKAKSFYKEGAYRGDSECKTHYMFYIMQDASHSGKHEDYMYCHNYLIQILNSNPELTEAYFYLGHLYQCGFGVLKDPNNAIHYYHKGAKLRNAACMTKLGDFYHSGYGVPQNQREAIKYYKMAADLKDSEAMINMGSIYEQGYEGIAVDHAKAFNYYEEACKLANSKAYFHIGLMYENGRYVRKDINQAIEQYKRSATMGCQEARDLLAKRQIPMIYDEGINSTGIEFEGMILINQDEPLIEKKNVLSSKIVPPLISNPIIANYGKKNNQNIMASRQSQMQDGRQPSILATQFVGQQSQYVQSQYK